MKNIRYKISVLICLGMTILFAAMITVFSIYYRHYFINEATNAIQNEAGLYNSDLTYDEYYARSCKELFQYDVSYLYVASDYTEEDYMGFTTSETDFIRYIHSLPAEYNQLKEYQTPGVYIIYMCTHSEDMEEGDMTVMYIDLAPFFQVSGNITAIFIIVGILLIIITTAIGWILGKKIDDSQRLQKEFFQNASHELKTPLMSIQGYTEAIQLGIMDSKSSADIIMEETEKMSLLVKDLLSLSKIDAGQMKLTMQPVDIREILYDCLRSVEAVMIEHEIEPSIDFDENDIKVNCDENAMRTVFSNILTNCIRYAGHNINLSFHIIKSEAVITISDDGPGMDDKTLRHLFERFYTGANGNTGIGLALSREIVNLHHGSLTAASSANGSTFKVTLPM